MGNGKTFRLKKESNFTVVSNELLYNKKLSLKSIGLMCILLSLPDDWEFSINGLAAMVRDGVETIRTCIKELKKERYIRIVKENPSADNPKISWTWYIYENQYRENQYIDNQCIEVQYIEKPIQLNTNKLNTNKPIYKKENPLKDVIEEFSEYREDIGKPFTTKSLMYFTQALSNYSNGDVETAKKIIQQAMVGGYQNIQPLREFKQVKPKKEKKLESESEYDVYNSYSPEEVEAMMADN